MDVPIVLAGHSHVHCMGVPGQGTDPGARLVTVDAAEALIEGVVGARDDAYWSAFVEASATRIPAVVWDGNQHYGYFMFAPQPPFDFILSSAPRLGRDRAVPIVPETLVRTFFAPSLEPLRDLLKRLRAASPYVPLVVGTPPPKGDLARICLNFASEPHFATWAAKLGVTLTADSLAPVTLMVKLWRLLQDMMSEIAAQQGGLFVPVPDRLITNAGVLPDDLWASDVTHTSPQYGREMLCEVISAAERAVAPARESAA